jgi:hypothetical protein
VWEKQWHTVGSVKIKRVEQKWNASGTDFKLMIFNTFDNPYLLLLSLPSL